MPFLPFNVKTTPEVLRYSYVSRICVSVRAIVRIKDRSSTRWSQKRIDGDQVHDEIFEKTVREDLPRSSYLAQIINAANPAPIVFCARSFLYLDARLPIHHFEPPRNAI